MKNKIITILVCMLVAIGSVFTVAASTSVENQISVTQNNSSKQVGNTLITESLYGNRVIEVDSSGNIVWEKAGLNNPWDAERLTNGNTLISDLGRVIEVDTGGTIVWEYDIGLISSFDAERLANGNTLIAGTYSNRVIEVDSSGSIVWQKTGLEAPVDVERLDNGNTLIVDGNAHRIIEVNIVGNIVWQKAGLNFPVDAERLTNGNTLITESQNNRVIEVDSNGNIVWEKAGLNNPWDAERLDNGNTLISDFGMVIEVDTGGNIVWEYFTYGIPTDAERINDPPDAPTITGPTSGKPNTEYDFTFNATDPNDDAVMYVIDWGDNNTEWTEYSDSGEEVMLKHNWSEKGDYTVKAKAIDIYDAESNWSVFEVEIPRTKTTFVSLLHWFLERFPLLERLLSLIRVI